MAASHFSGPVYSANGFVGDLTGSVTLPTGLTVTTLAVTTTSTLTGVATFTAQPILSSLTASRPVFTDGSKGLVSSTVTGTGAVVQAVGPTLTGTAGFQAGTFATTLVVTGVATFTAQPILSSLTASLPVFTDGSKGLISGTQTGTGTSVVVSVSPVITGTPKITNPVNPHTPTVVNATATLTGTQASSGYIKTTSTSAVGLTMPTGTDLGTVLGAVQGTTFDLFFDNTASSGSGEVTVIVNTNAILSAAAEAEAGGSGLLTVPVGATGQAGFRLMFSSATTYTFTRIA